MRTRGLISDALAVGGGWVVAVDAEVEGGGWVVAAGFEGSMSSPMMRWFRCKLGIHWTTATGSLPTE